MLSFALKFLIGMAAWFALVAVLVRLDRRWMRRANRRQLVQELGEPYLAFQEAGEQFLDRLTTVAVRHRLPLAKEPSAKKHSAVSKTTADG